MKKFFSPKPQPLDVKAVADQYQEQIEALVSALESGDAAVDLKLAALLEGVPDRVRTVIVDRLRERLAQRDEAKARALDQLVEEQRTREEQEKVAQHWLAYFMSQETLRKIRESFLGSPGLKQQVEALGQELSRKGVIGQSLGRKQELGELPSTLQYVKNQSQQQGKDSGKGR